MKFKSKILGHDKPLIAIETLDDYNHKSHFREEKVNIENEKIEEIKICNLITEGILIVDTHMYFSKPQTIQTEMIGEAIVMNFICNSNVEIYTDQLEKNKYSLEHTHNILYVSKLNASFKIPALEKINYLSIILSPEFYSKLINEDWGLHTAFSKNISKKKTGYITPKYVPFTPEIQWIIHEIKNCSYDGAMKKMYLEAKIKELLIMQLDTLIEKPQNKIEVGEDEYKKLLKAKAILEETFTKAPSLAELSRLISLNEFKLKKGFKACFETTVKEYVTKLRMEYAKKLFKNKTSNVGEVAYKCGYKDVSHFSASFKFFYGFTPIRFRNMNIKIQLLYWGFEELLPNLLYLV